MARVVQTSSEYNYFLNQNSKTVVFITQQHCGACKPTEEQLLRNNFAAKYPDLTFIVAFYDSMDMRQAIGTIQGTPTTRIYQNGKQICNELLGGTFQHFEALVSSHSANRVNNNTNNNSNYNNYYYPNQYRYY